MMRTSEKYPLRISSVSTGEAKIGMTICPGKVGPSQTGPDWGRDLHLDTTEIFKARYDAVLTLMEVHEMAEYRVSDMGEVVRKTGMRWYHFPVIDQNIPRDEAAPAWKVISDDIMAGFKDGRSVLIHCLGGLGRTGVAAACLLQDAGVCSTASMQKVRAARPGAIENKLQEGFVQSYRSWRTA